MDLKGRFWRRNSENRAFVFPPFSFCTSKRHSGQCSNSASRSLAARNKAARGDKSHGLTGIGDSGSVSLNPLGIGPSPAPAYTQPNPAPSVTVAVPAGTLNPMKVSASPNYVQPGTANPKPNSWGTVSAKKTDGTVAREQNDIWVYLSKGARIPSKWTYLSIH